MLQEILQLSRAWARSLRKSLLAVVVCFLAPLTTHATIATIQLNTSDVVSFGMEVEYTGSVLNDTTQSQILDIDYFVIDPHGNSTLICDREPRPVHPNRVAQELGMLNSGNVSALLGTFTLLVRAMDTQGSVLSQATVPFTVTPPPPLGPTDPTFTDVAALAGVDAPHQRNVTEDCFANINTGAGWADYNGDGTIDLFVTNSAGPTHLYRNNGDGTFTDVAAVAGVLLNGPMLSGVSWADYNNDGHPDLLLVANGPSFLFRNNGDGTFTDVTAHAGVAGGDGRGTTASWGDYDSDGWLDLYVGAHLLCIRGTPGGGRVSQDHLFHNNGDGTFTDVTHLLNNKGPQTTANTHSQIWFDYDHDSDLDLYVVRDYLAGNVLWRNDGADGTGGWVFTDVSAAAGADKLMYAMGIAFGDYNHDGAFDLFVTNINDNVLLRNNGDGTFTNVAADARVNRPKIYGCKAQVTWGAGFYDFNNDTWEDLYAAAGAIPRELDVHDVTPLANELFVNNGDGTFRDLSILSGTHDSHVGRTVAFADYDGDGCVDIFLANYGQTPLLYHNNCTSQGNLNTWLQIRTRGSVSNRDGIGAKVTITAGGVTQVRQVLSGSSLGAGNDLAVYFGLGNATVVDTLEIRWPSGLVQTLHEMAVNQRLTVVEAESKGLVLGASLEISDAPGQETFPSVAYNSLDNTYLITWTDHSLQAVNGSDVYGRLVHPDGRLGGELLPIATATGEQTQAAAAYSPVDNRFLVVFVDSRTESTTRFDLYGQLVSHDGTQIGDHFPVAVAPNDQNRPAIAYDPIYNRYLAIWQDNRQRVGNWHMYAQFIAANGTLVGENFIVTSGIIGASEDRPGIAYNAVEQNYLVVWADNRNKNTTGVDIFGRFVASDGTLQGNDFPIGNAPRDQFHPGLAYDPEKHVFLVAWTGCEHSSDLCSNRQQTGTDIFAQMVSGQGSLLGPSIAVATEASPQYRPGVSYASGDKLFLVMWADERQRSTRGIDAYAQLISPHGYVVGDNTLISVATDNSNQHPLGITYNLVDDQFLVVFKSNQSDLGNIFGQFLTIESLP